MSWPSGRSTSCSGPAWSCTMCPWPSRCVTFRFRRHGFALRALGRHDAVPSGAWSSGRGTSVSLPSGRSTSCSGPSWRCTLCDWAGATSGSAGMVLHFVPSAVITLYFGRLVVSTSLRCTGLTRRGRRLPPVGTGPREQGGARFERQRPLRSRRWRRHAGRASGSHIARVPGFGAHGSCSSWWRRST